MAKTSEKSSSDRMSGLPKPLLHHILSFLPTRNMIQTCLLSTFWRNIWWSVPTFDFHENSFSDFKDFVKFVDAALFFRDGSDIIKFVLCTSCGQEESKVNDWILYAIRHNMQVLDMKIDSFQRCVFQENHHLVRYIYNSESLRVLKLQFCNLTLPSLISLPALRKLHLLNANVKNGELLTNLCSSSPLLESIILEQCELECSMITISASQLQNLKLSGFMPSLIVISAPNLISVSICTRWKSRIELKSNFLSLADVVIRSEDLDTETVIHLMSKAKNVQSLYLILSTSSPLVKELQDDFSIVEQIQTSFCNLKKLRFGTMFSNIEFLIINKILTNSPQIKSLFFTNTQDPRFIDKFTVQTGNYELDYNQEGTLWSKYDLPHLKSAEIQNFRGSDNEVKMLKFLMENALVLEKMIIMVAKDKKRVGNQEMCKIRRNLLACREASATVGALLEFKMKIML